MEKTIDIKGMHCTSCVKLIETKLSRLKGVNKVKVSLVEEKAFIQFDPKQITQDVIKEEIIDLGYAVDGKNKKTSKGKKANGSGRDSTLFQGLIYGLVPHIGCIAFIIATILGTTVAIELFKPLLMNPYFFYILIAISFIFATVSSFFYLKKQGFITFGRIGNKIEMSFSRNTLKRKWKYLSTMYGITIFINLFLFFIMFPALANINSGISITGAFAADSSLSLMTLQVNIPCPGHAPLITGELRKISGVKAVEYKFPNIFDVGYDSTIVSEEGILDIDVFNTYKPTVLDGSDGAVNQVDSGSTTNSGPAVGGCGAGCGGGCGAGSGGCGCGG